MFSNYFNPVSEAIIDFKSKLNQNQIGSHVTCYYDDVFPDINNTDIAIIIVPENRGSSIKLESSAYFSFRKSFYSLFRGNWQFRIKDFGDLKLGNDLRDTYFALNDIISKVTSEIG